MQITISCHLATFLTLKLCYDSSSFGTEAEARGHKSTWNYSTINVQCHVFTAQAVLQQNACIQSHALDSLTLWGPHILQSSLRSPTCSCIYELPDPEGRKTKKTLLSKSSGFCQWLFRIYSTETAWLENFEIWKTGLCASVGHEIVNCPA